MTASRTDRPPVSRLPPPPAPTSRDANPWPMPGQNGANTQRGWGQPPPVSGAPPASWRSTAPDSRATPLRWLPVVVLGGMAAVAAAVAVTAIESRDPRAAIGPLLMLAFVAFAAWRRFGAKRQPPARKR
jgi:hypothetical protein